MSAVTRRVADAEAGLVSGVFEAALRYQDGSASASTLQFVLGSGYVAPSLHMTSTYTSTQGAITMERIAVGSQGWQRQDNQAWSPSPEAEGVWGQLQSYLPHVASAQNVQFEQGDPGVLVWRDTAHGLDVRLEVDRATGVPQQMRQTSTATGSVLTVRYRQWNTPQSILPPPGQ